MDTEYRVNLENAALPVLKQETQGAKNDKYMYMSHV